MGQVVTFEPATATVNVSMLGLPKATGNVVFTVVAYSGDDVRIALEGTDIRLGKGTSYTVTNRAIALDAALEEAPALGRYSFHPFATVTGRAATKPIEEQLADVALASLSAVVQDTGFAEWLLAAHAELLRATTVKDLKRRIEYAKMSLVDDEHALQACHDLISATGPLTNEQLKLALALTKSNHSLGTAIEAARKI
jgi:hypothetical protein